MLVILTRRVRLDSLPTMYLGSFHHGRPKSVAHAVLGLGGGTWIKRPCGVKGSSRPVTASMQVRSWAGGVGADKPV